jgi:tripartite-type tricarboxylate transporter receptor subunit TctC
MSIIPGVHDDNPNIRSGRMMKVQARCFTPIDHAASQLIRSAALILWLAFSMLPSSAFAQETRGKLITIIVPFTAGSGPDVTARAFVDPLGEELNQTIIVENRIGASGNIGTASVARAEPDGTTLLLTANTIVLNPGIFKKIGYDPIKSFTPIMLVAKGHMALAVSTKIPSNTLSEFIALAKSSPGKINYASPGRGTPHHLAMELLQNSTGAKMTHVPYSGLAKTVTDLTGGHVDAMFVGLHSIAPLARSAKVKIIGVSSLQRAQSATDIPTIAEQGLPGFEVETWFGLLAPAGTPHDVVERINVALNRVLQRPAINSSFKAQGLELVGGTPDALGDLLKSDQVKWLKVIRDAGIAAE